jgi:multiple sugar transport system permease protein
MITKKSFFKKLFPAYLFLLPNISGFLCFTLLPVVASFVLVFFEWDVLTTPKFVGLLNFITLLKDKDFWYYLYNTLFFMLAIPLNMAVSLFLAILVNQKLKGITLFRTIYFLPVISPIVAVALLWRWIYNPDFGLLNSFLRLFITHPPEWLSSTTWAKPAIIIMSVWQGCGYTMLLYLAALQSIPEELYEAARIDGATAWQQFKNITWPMLSFVNFFIVIMGIISGFQAFGVQYVMTGGGPAGSTTTIVYYIYNNAFQWFKMGYASAIAWVLFLLVFGFTLLQWKLSKKGGQYF